MASLIFNREEFKHPADGWHQIEAKGEHPNAAAGVDQVIDDEAMKSIVEDFNANAVAGTLRHGNEMLLDIEHFSSQPDQESRAYGWVQELQNRDDGIYAKIKWTTTGQAAVDGGDYRFFSTEYDPADLEVIGQDSQGMKRVRPMKLAGLTLTNMNNNLGQKPITNRDNYGSHGTKEAWEAAKAENQRHVAANKAAAQEVESKRLADSEGEEAELALPALEKFCRAVQQVIKSASRTGKPMMSFQTAWTYAQQKFPALYDAAFGDGTTADAGAASAQITALSNRLGTMAGKNFEFGFNFVREELPHIFNRMTPGSGRIKNRTAWCQDRTLAVLQASKIFNRLVRAEVAITGLPDSQAWRAIAKRHPGLYGLAEGRILTSEALRAEPSLAALMA